MRKIFLYSMVALVSIAFASLAGLYGLYQGRLADAQESFSTFDFKKADDSYGMAEKYLRYGRNVPWLLDAEFVDMKNRHSQANYWLGQYEELAGDFQTQPGQAKGSDPENDFIRANAFYRLLEKETDKSRVLNLLDKAIVGYTDAINGDSGNFNAAFDYEYLAKTREEVSSGKKKLPLNQPGKDKKPMQGDGDQSGQPGNIHGQEGAQLKAEGAEKIRIYVPKSGDEAKEKGGENAGKGTITRKKG